MWKLFEMTRHDIWMCLRCVHVVLTGVGKRLHVWVSMCAKCAKHFRTFPKPFQNIRNRFKTCENSLQRPDMTFVSVWDVFMLFWKKLGNVCMCEWVCVPSVPIIFEHFRTPSKRSWSTQKHVETVCNEISFHFTCLWCFHRVLKGVGKRLNMWVSISA